jgi:hypothetical protein
MVCQSAASIGRIGDAVWDGQRTTYRDWLEMVYPLHLIGLDALR